MKYSIKISILVFLLHAYILCSAQSNKSILVTVSATGKNKDDAENNALKKAVLQTFKSYITLKTEIKNDSIINDEIIAITNGSINSFKEITLYNLDDGSKSITLSVELVPSKIYTSFKTKGFEVELNGSLFAQNILLKELNADNEYLVLYDFYDVALNQIKYLFDYEIEVDQPKKINESMYGIGIQVNVRSSNNSKEFFDWMESIVKSISLNKDEIKEYKSLDLPFYNFSLVYGNGVSWSGRDYVFRNKKSLDLLNILFKQIVLSFTNLSMNIVNSENIKVGHFQDAFQVESLNSQFYISPYAAKKVDNIKKEMNEYRDKYDFFIIKNGKLIGTFKNIDLMTIEELKKINRYKIKYAK